MINCGRLGSSKRRWATDQASGRHSFSLAIRGSPQSPRSNRRPVSTTGKRTEDVHHPGSTADSGVQSTPDCADNARMLFGSFDTVQRPGAPAEALVARGHHPRKQVQNHCVHHSVPERIEHRQLDALSGMGRTLSPFRNPDDSSRGVYPNDAHADFNSVNGGPFLLRESYLVSRGKPAPPFHQERGAHGDPHSAGFRGYPGRPGSAT